MDPSTTPDAGVPPQALAGDAPLHASNPAVAESSPAPTSSSSSLSSSSPSAVVPTAIPAVVASTSDALATTAVAASASTSSQPVGSVSDHAPSESDSQAEPTCPRSPLTAPPTWNIDRALTTTTSQPPQTTEKIVPLLSVSPDGSKTRLFHAKYFLPVQSDPSTSRMVDLPESYFAPTAVELQTAFAGQVKKREDLLERPLMTQMLRDREEATKSRERASRWPQTRIRVRFADRSQLEGVFPSTDKMVAIYEFVKLALSEEIRQTPFLLYQTPPRREFPEGDLNSRGKSLMDLELTPSSVFYIKFLERQELDTMKPPPLRPELIGAAVQFPLPPPFDPTAKPPPETSGKKTSTGQKLGFGGSSGKVTPSWMKLGKK